MSTQRRLCLEDSLLNCRQRPENLEPGKIAELVVDDGVLQIFQGLRGLSVRRVLWLCDADTRHVLNASISCVDLDVGHCDFPTGYEVAGKEVMFSPSKRRGYLADNIPKVGEVIDTYPEMILPIPSFAFSDEEDEDE